MPSTGETSVASGHRVGVPLSVSLGVPLAAYPDVFFVKVDVLERRPAASDDAVPAGVNTHSVLLH